jgi:hypothetical protein
VRLDDVGEEIAIRELQWQGSDGSHGAVKVRIGKPQQFEDSVDFYCPVQVIGIGAADVKYAAGADAIQAILLALRMLRVELETRQMEHSGQLTWLGDRSLGLDLF